MKPSEVPGDNVSPTLCHSQVRKHLLSNSSSHSTANSHGGRRVRFDTSSNTSFDCNHASPSDEEMDQLWLSRQEYKQIKKSTRFLVQLLESGVDEDDDVDKCFRGLEYKTRVEYRRRRKDIEMSIDTVLMEQERQWEEGIRDPTYIADVYRQTVAHCRVEAHKLAHKDSIAVSDDSLQVHKPSIDGPKQLDTKGFHSSASFSASARPIRVLTTVLPAISNPGRNMVTQ